MIFRPPPKHKAKSPPMQGNKLIFLSLDWRIEPLLRHLNYDTWSILVFTDLNNKGLRYVIQLRNTANIVIFTYNKDFSYVTSIMKYIYYLYF